MFGAVLPPQYVPMAWRMLVMKHRHARSFALQEFTAQTPLVGDNESKTCKYLRIFRNEVSDRVGLAFPPPSNFPSVR
jgi:hypothetical protein